MAAANATLAAAGLSARLDARTDAAIALRGGKAMLRTGFQRAGQGDEALAEALYPALLDQYRAAIATHSRAYPGMEPALDTLARTGWRLSVCTNKPEGLARLLLSELGLLTRFAALVGADTLPVRKPDPRPVWEAAERAGGHRSRAVMIGDTDTDHDAARAAGIPVILVAWGPEAERNAHLTPDAIADEPADLPRLLDALLPA